MAEAAREGGGGAQEAEGQTGQAQGDQVYSTRYKISGRIRF
jgi:hypothetical protein